MRLQKGQKPEKGKKDKKDNGKEKRNVMLSLFRKIKPLVMDAPMPEMPVSVTPGFIEPQTVEQLLNTPRRQKLLAHIWQRTSISRNQFALLYLKPIERYAELVQLFPASESHHHAYPGGMLDHGLEIVAYALKLRQSYLLPIGSTPEEQTVQSEVWTAGIAYAALLHDIGKIAVDLYVEYENTEVWHPWHGPVSQAYRFRYQKNREYRLHEACSGLVYHQILDSPILDWLSRTHDLWSALLYVLAGHTERAGVLGEIVTKADQASVAHELGGDPAKVMEAPKHSLPRKLLDGLRYLVKEQLKLNNPGPSDGWLTDDALWLVSKTVSDKLRAHLLASGVSGIPEKNSAIFDVLQEHSIIQATAEGKAIWNATVNSASSWKNNFTFLKVSPTLIWEKGERPMSFEGSVITSPEPQVTDIKTALSEISPPESQALITDSPFDTSIPIPLASIQPELKADSLEAVFDLLGLESGHVPHQEHDTDTQEVDIGTVAEISETGNVEIVDHRSQQKSRNNVRSTDISQPRLPILFPALKPGITSMPEDNVPSGEHFMTWLKEAILSKKLIINDARALVHTVADTIFIVTPGIFNRYAQEFPAVQLLATQAGIPEWRWVQKQFEHQKQHTKQPDGLNIWTCVVSGPHKTRQVHGYLLADPRWIMPEVPFNNPYLKLKQVDGG